SSWIASLSGPAISHSLVSVPALHGLNFGQCVGSSHFRHIMHSNLALILLGTSARPRVFSSETEQDRFISDAVFFVRQFHFGIYHTFYQLEVLLQIESLRFLTVKVRQPQQGLGDVQLSECFGVVVGEVSGGGG